MPTANSTEEKAYRNRRNNSGFSMEERPRANGKSAWRIRIDVIDRDTGKNKWLTIGTYDTKTEAQKEGAKAVAQRERGTLLRPDSATMGELLDDWLQNEL